MNFIALKKNIKRKLSGLKFAMMFFVASFFFAGTALAASTVSQISPTSGPATGGTNVTITGTNFFPPNSGGAAGWATLTGKTLPNNLFGSHLATIGSNLYLFGGNNGTAVVNTIYTATVADPTAWTLVAGKTLPGTVQYSQLAIVGSNLYLFGGYIGGGATNAIYTATVADPTTWTIVAGKTLPGNIYGSQLATVGNNLYLFGGNNGSAGVNTIYTATVADPTTWTVVAGKTLPGNINGSQLAIVGNNLYLFGGVNGAAYTNAIYTATVADPTTWTTVAGKTLPGVLGWSQTIIIGDYIYLLGGYNGAAGVNSIYRAPVSDPTTWTTVAGVLPTISYLHSIAIINNTAYIFGGVNTAASNVIFGASLTHNRPNVFNKSWLTNWDTITTDQSTVTIGGTQATNINFVSATSITVTTPAHTAGVTDVVVTGYDGQSATLTNGYTFNNPPTISAGGVSPSSAKSTGGDTITITGTGFYGTPTVTLGGTAATAVTVINSTTMTVTTPAHAIGQVNVVVTNQDGQGATLTNGFTFADLPPTVGSISPASGPVTGGTDVTITGTNFFPPNSGGVTGWVNVSGKTLPANVLYASRVVVGEFIYLLGGGDGVSAYYNTIYRAPITDPTNWTNTGKTLPTPLYGAQTVVANGYVYLFGGYNGSAHTGVIYRAPVTDPTTWTNTGKTLPGILDYAQLAVVGNNIYLYGGYNGAATVDVIYTATVADPTTWTNTGKTLPVTLRGEELAIIGNNMYLYGGYTGTVFTSTIYTASVSDPTTWSIVAGKTLPANLFGSQLAIIGNNMYLYGGFNGTAAINTIYTTTTTDPTTWTISSSVLPAALYMSQVTIIDNYIYLFGGYTSVATNVIYRVPVTHNRPNVSNKSWLTNWGTVGADQSGVAFGGIPATNVSFINSTTVTAKTPASFVGVADVTVTNYDGQSATLTDGYAYITPPSITSITPNSALLTGGGTVTITGSDFFGTPVVSFGGAMSSNVTFVNATTLSVVVPAHNVGRYDIVVTNPDGQSATFANGFIYNNLAPSISAVTPDVGPISGGTSVAITGTRFDNFFAYDNFSDDNRNTQLWSLATNGSEAGVSVQETNQELKISGSVMATDFSSRGFQFVPTLPAFGNEQWEYSVDFKLPSSPGGVNNRFMMHLAGSNGQVTLEVLPSSGYRIEYFNGSSWSESSPVPLFGNESTAYHKLKILYNPVTKQIQAFVDSTSVATVTNNLGTALTGLALINQSISGGEGVIDLRFDNFRIRRITPGFPDGFPSVTFGGVSAADALFASSTLVTATNPAHPLGSVDVVVTNCDGQNFESPLAFTYLQDRYGFINNPFNLRETESGELTIQAQDENGNPVISPIDVVLSLSSTSATGFFARSLTEDPVTRWNYNTVILPAGQSSVTFYYKDNQKGAPIISVIAPIGEGRTVTVAQQEVITSKYRFLVTGVTDPVKAGIPSSVTMQAVDYQGQPLSDYTGTVHFASTDVGAIVPPDFNFTPDMLGEHTFVNGVTMTTQGEWCVSATDASDPVITGSQCAITVGPPNSGTISQIKIITNSQSFPADSHTSAITVQAQDLNGVPIPVPLATKIYVYTDSLTGQFSPNGEDSWTAIQPFEITIPQNATSTSFYYKDQTLGGHLLTVREDQGTGPNVGWENDSQVATTVSGSAYRLVVTPPAAKILVGGASDAFTVSLQDIQGNIITTLSNKTIYLTTSSNGGMFSRDPVLNDWQQTKPTFIPAGSSTITFYYKSVYSGSQIITVSDNNPPDGAVGLLDDSKTVGVFSETVSKFVFTTPAFQVTAGDVSPKITIEAQDQFNNPVLVTNDTPVYLTMSEAGGVFSSDISFASMINTVTIPMGSSSVDFYFKQRINVSSQTITASDNAIAPDGATGIIDIAQTENIVPGAVNKFAITNTLPISTVAGAEVGPLTLQTQNQYGIEIPVTVNTPVYFHTNSTGPVKEFSLGSGGSWSPTASTVLMNGQSSVDFYYKESKAGTSMITVGDDSAAGADNNITNAQLDILTSATTLNKLGFATNPQTLEKGQLVPFTIQSQDTYGNPQSVAGDTVVYLTSSSATGVFQDVLAQPITTITIPAGSNNKTFYYKDTTLGNPTITISDNPYPDNPDAGLVNATQTETIINGAAKKFILSAVSNMLTAGSPSSLGTLRIFNDYDQPVPAVGNITVDLSSSSANGYFDTNPAGAFALTSVTVLDGQQSVDFYYKDTTAGSPTITASKTNYTSGSYTFNVGASMALNAVFINPVRTTAAGNSSNIFTLQFRDQYGNVAVLAAPETINVSSNNAVSGTFAVSSSGPWDMTQLWVAAGLSTASFYYKDTLIGNKTITVTPSVLAGSAQDTIITPGLAHHFGITSNTQTIIAQNASDMITVSVYDQHDNLTTVLADTNVILSSDSLQYQFSVNQSPWNSVSTMVLASGQGALSVSYKDWELGTPTIMARHNTGVILAATQQEVIIAGPPSRMMFGGSVQTIVTDTPSLPISFFVADANGYQTNATSNTTVTISSSSISGEFSLDGENDWAPTQNIMVLAGESQKAIYYRDRTEGTFTLTAAATELTNGTQNINVIAGTISQIIVNAADTASVGVAVPVVVQLQTSGGLPAAVLADTVIDLTKTGTTGSFSLTASPWNAVTSITIPAWQYQKTLYYKDTSVGSKTITADEYISQGWTAGSKDVTFSASVFSKFGFVAKPDFSVVGNASGAFTVQMQDQFGNVVIAGSDTVAYLYNSGGGSFAVDVAGPWNLTNVTIPTGLSAATFYYKDDVMGNKTITVSDQSFLDSPDIAIANATATVTVAGQTPTQLAIISAPQTITAGTWTGAITIEAQQSDNSPAILENPLLVDLSENPLGTGNFSLTPGGSVVSQVTIPAGFSGVTVYYTSNTAGTFTLYASASGLNQAAQNVVVNADVAKKWVFLTSAQTKQAGAESTQMRVQLQDSFGNAVNATSDMMLTFSTTSIEGQFSILNGVGWSALGSVVLSAGSNDVFFYYKDMRSGIATLSVKENPDAGLIAATQPFTVSAGNIASIGFTTPAQSLLVGQVSDIMTVTLYDAFGNVKITPTTFTAYLYSSSPQGSFSTYADFRSTVTSITFAAGQSAKSFYYKDNAQNNPTITISDASVLDIPDTGVTNAVQNEQIIWGAVYSFVFENAAASLVAGQSKAFDVVLKNAYGVEIPASSNINVFFSSSHETGKFSLSNSFTAGDLISSVAIVVGSSRRTIYYSDTTSSNVTLTASDVSTPAENPDAGIINGSQTFAVIAGDVSSLAFVTSAQNLEVGQPSGAMRVEARDVYGNAKVVDADVSVYFTSDSATAKFSLSSSFAVGNLVTEGKILAGNSSVVFYLRDVTAGTPKITVSDQTPLDDPDIGIANAQQIEMIVTGNIAKLSFQISANPVVAGGVSDPIVLQTLNQYDVNIPVIADTTIYLFSSAPTGKFAPTVGGPWTGNTLTIPLGEKSVQFYYRDTEEGVPTLTASETAVASPDTGWTNAISQITVDPGAITQIAIISDPQAITARHPSQAMQFQTRNIYGNPTKVKTSTPIYLRSDSIGGEFSTSPGSGWGLSNIIVPVGTHTVTFYYHDSVVGVPTVTVSDNLPPNPDADWVNATQQETIQVQVVDHLLVTNISDPQKQGDPSSVVVMAQDAENYVVDWYTGTVHFTSSDVDAYIPEDYTFVASDKGIHTFGNAIAFLHSGEKTVTATDTEAITGTQYDITVLGNNAGPITQVKFIGVTPPLALNKDTVSQVIAVQTQDASGQSSNAPAGGFPIRITSDSLTGEFALTPSGPWTSVGLFTIPEGLNSVNLYYRDSSIGTPTITASDWIGNFDDPGLGNDTLAAIVKSLKVDVNSALQVNNNGHYYVDNPLIFAKNDTGAYRGKTTFQINVTDEATGLPRNANLTLVWKDFLGNVISTELIMNVNSYSYNIMPIDGFAADGNYTFEVQAVDMITGVTGNSITQVPVSGWTINVNYDPNNKTIDVPLSFTVETRFNGVLADPYDFSVNFKDNNGDDVVGAQYKKVMANLIKTGIGQYNSTMPTTGLPVNLAFYLFARIYDVSNTTMAEDNHFDIYFQNNPALAPQNFHIEKILTSIPPADETYDLKFTWNEVGNATTYNLYRSRDKFATLFQDPCSFEQIKFNNRFGNPGATPPFCETQIQQNVGADDATQWVKMATINAPASSHTVPWSQIQADLLNDEYYYILRAENGLGESGYSTMVFSMRKSFDYNAPPISNVNWISLPYYNGKYTNASFVAQRITKASDIIRDIEGDVAGDVGDDKNIKIDRIALWESGTQDASSSYSYSLATHKWLGTDFTINPGDGIYLRTSGITNSFTWTLVGNDISESGRALTYNDAPATNINWIAIPYSTKYAKASEVVVDLEGALVGSAGNDKNRKIDRIALWESETQDASLTYSYSLSMHKWVGMDFAINPGSGIYLRLSGGTPSFNWNQPLLLMPYE